MDGFAQSHLIGKKGALAEGKVEHAIALVGEKRVERDLLGMAAVANADLVVAPCEDAVALTGAVGKPSLDILRNAQIGRGIFKECFEEGLGVEVGNLKSLGIKEGAMAVGEFVEVAFHPKTVGFGVGNDVDAWRRDALGCRKFGAVASGKVEKNSLDMLACAESVDAEIGAGAGNCAVAMSRISAR